MKFHKSNIATPYPLYSASIESIGELIDLVYPSEYFVLFLAADFNKIENDLLLDIAKKLIDKGLAYTCTWGPGCENAHAAFDLANVLWEEENGKEFHVMSTGHDDEPLIEALWFCIFIATVDDEYWGKCSTIVVSINEKNWTEIIDESLTDVSAFNDRIVNG